MKDDLIWYALVGKSQMNIRLREQWIGVLIQNQIQNSENFQKWEYSVDITLLDPTGENTPEDNLPENMQVLVAGESQEQVLQDGQHQLEEILGRILARKEKDALFSNDQPFQEHASTLPDEVATAIQELGRRPMTERKKILEILELLPLDLRYTVLERYSSFQRFLDGENQKDLE